MISEGKTHFLPRLLRGRDINVDMLKTEDKRKNTLNKSTQRRHSSSVCFWLEYNSSYSLGVGDDVAEDVVVGLLPAGFDVQLKFGHVHRLLVRFLVHERSRRRRHLLDPALHLRHLLHRLRGVLLLHLHPDLAGPTLDVFQPHLAASGRLQGGVVQVSCGRSAVGGGFVQVGEKFGEEASALRLKDKNV